MPVPVPSGPFIGRARELAEIGALLRQPDVRLITLIGMGGIGKTRLALEAASRVDRDDFPDGAAFISLASVRDPALLPEAIASDLAVPETPGQSRERDLIEFVRLREMLLVLDNFEQIREGRYLIAQMLEAAPSGFVTLVTSQHPLELGWERTYPVTELTPPDVRAGHDVDDLRGNDAVCLFETYAIASNRAFRLNSSNAGQIAEICRRLEGIPLALELAAARIRSTDPDRLLHLLNPRLGLLTRGEGNHPERLRTMANAISWSYDLLTPRQQRLFRRLSVFAAGFGAESAAQIGAGAPPVESGAGARVRHRNAEQALQDDLDELVKASLLRFDLLSDSRGRYRMLGSVREFALAELKAADETAETSWTFVASVLAFVEEIKPELRGERAADALLRLEAEHPNVQAALEWSIGQGAAGNESALRMCTAVWSFWKQRGYLREAEKWLRAAIASAGDEESLHLGNGYLLLGHTVNDQKLGWAYYERALGLYRRFGSPRYVAGTLNSLGQAAIGQGDYRRAKSLLLENLRLSEREASAGSASDLAHVHYQLGVLSSRLHETNSAIEHLDQARMLWEESGQSIDVINAILELGRVEGDRGKFEVAVDLLKWALARARATNDLDAEGRALYELGRLEAYRGNDREALDYLRSALQLYRTTGYPFVHLVETIEAVAAACVRHHQAELAAMLFGFADNWRKRTSSALHPSEEQGREKIVDSAKRRLGAASFELAWNRGLRLIQLEEVIETVGTIEVKPGKGAAMPPAGPAGGKLTKREFEVLCHLAKGLKYRDIAVALGVGEPTIKKFVERIYDALDVNNRTAATAYAFQHGLCDPGPARE